MQWASALFNKIIPVLNQFKMAKGEQKKLSKFFVIQLIWVSAHCFLLHYGWSKMKETSPTVSMDAPHQRRHNANRMNRIRTHCDEVAFEPTNMLSLCLFSVYSLFKKLTTCSSIEVSVHFIVRWKSRGNCVGGGDKVHSWADKANEWKKNTTQKWQIISNKAFLSGFFFS